MPDFEHQKIYNHSTSLQGALFIIAAMETKGIRAPKTLN